jgi:hypothetical protein
MSEDFLFALSLPLAIAVGAIFTKFIVLCQEAHEEEFKLRRKAVVLASTNEAERAQIR